MARKRHPAPMIIPSTSPTAALRRILAIGTVCLTCRNLNGRNPLRDLRFGFKASLCGFGQTVITFAVTSEGASRLGIPDSPA
jgi:hypothetical protein